MQIYLPYRFLFYQDYPWILDANREKKFASAKKSSLPRKKFASANFGRTFCSLKKEAAAASNLLLFQDMT